MAGRESATIPQNEFAESDETEIGEDTMTVELKGSVYTVEYELDDQIVFNDETKTSRLIPKIKVKSIVNQTTYEDVDPDSETGLEVMSEAARLYANIHPPIELENYSSEDQPDKE